MEETKLIKVRCVSLSICISVCAFVDALSKRRVVCLWIQRPMQIANPKSVFGGGIATDVPCTDSYSIPGFGKMNLTSLPRHHRVMPRSNGTEEQIE